MKKHNIHGIRAARSIHDIRSARATRNASALRSTRDSNSKINAKIGSNASAKVSTKQNLAATSTNYKQRLHFVATHTANDVLAYTSSNDAGLQEVQVYEHRKRWGSNNIAHKQKIPVSKRLAEAFINPFTAILFCLASVSTVNDIIFPLFGLFGATPQDFNCVSVVIIVSMVTISGLLRFVQETKSSRAAEKLLAMITTTATVKRAGELQEVQLDDVVVGDIIRLGVGDMLPADVRFLATKDLFVNQASLTGESEPQEKTSHKLKKENSALGYGNLGFMGTNVISGGGEAVVVAVGKKTMFGSMTETMAQDAPETSFAKGVNEVSWVLIRFMMVMVPLVFVINGFTKGNWVSAFLFAISVAVGLTPEMLPMIVATCLAKGAIKMSQKQTIVKNLNSIQSFGAMDVLCTDKTGTLTQNKVVLEYHLNIHGEDDLSVLRHAYLNSYFQTGYKNLMDMAIIQKTEEEETKDQSLIDLSEHYVKVDEIPFDFVRRRLSIVVEDRKKNTLMVTKGAVEEILSICSQAQDGEALLPINDELRQKVVAMSQELNEKGFRVLGLAKKDNPSPVGAFSVKDECNMVFLGYLAFLDPPKESTRAALQALKSHGVVTKILTGDNEKVTRTICQQVGLEVSGMLMGEEVDSLSDEVLCERAQVSQVFAKLTPDQKARIVRVLRERGHTVGYMGDGINDAAAMKEADIGISVDDAVDIAKESADIVLLQKDLTVLEEGIIEGRKTYANMVKYIKMTASSNFGNMFSVLAASAFLPFLPMQSLHLIILSLIYDLSCTAIPWDNVDPELIVRPRSWDARSVGSFMVWFGPTSSLFDFMTYLVLYFILCPLVVSDGVLFGDLARVYSGATLEQLQLAYIALFQTGWFVESMWSQTLVIHMIRTARLPFIQSKSSGQLSFLTACGMLALTCVPFLPFASAIGLCALPPVYFVYLFVCVVLYMVCVTLVKHFYIKAHGELL